ncbi:MAG TPA: hypothetical protein VFE37_28280 [Chloroflexota bacterium]|nr:hypothetical protein [Chloroflexota bacterium]
MALKPETAEHLARAERNRAIARALCDPQQCSSVQPPPWEWAAVAGFYAALHYVHALLWELHGLTPHDHPARRGYVARTAPLNRVLGAYDTLYDLGWQARYRRTFRPKPQEVLTAVHQQLDTIRSLVYRVLSVEAP